MIASQARGASHDCAWQHCGLIFSRGTALQDGLPLHLAAVAVLSVGQYDDAFRRRLRWAGVRFWCCRNLCRRFSGEFPLPFRSGCPIYGAAVVIATFAYAYGTGSPAYFFAGLANMSLLTGRLLFELAGILKRLFDWEGAAWFVWGLVWFALGVAISAWKAGLAGRLARFVPRGHKAGAAKP